jgi:tRNA A-37 threonylcarbamoyl transferase component Bud32
MSAIGQALADRYRIEALLGAGGMATVYRARDLRLGRRVAVKVLSPNLASDATLSRRFDQEARFLAAVSHPSIVNVFDVGQADGEPFFVMELVEGDTLADRLAADGTLAPDEAVPIVTQIADGLAVLHQAGFVHRDVKPQNILLPRDGPAKLTDFGLVRGEQASDLTAPGTTVGTLAYLAPEMLRGDPATPSSDVYALAAVAYEALTGRPPYPVETVVGLVEGQRVPPPLPSSAAPWLSTSFDAPLLKALASDDRPAMGEFAGSLRAAESGWRAAGGHGPGERRASIRGPDGEFSAASALAAVTSAVVGGMNASRAVDSTASTRAHPVGRTTGHSSTLETTWSERSDRATSRLRWLLGALAIVLALAVIAALAGGLGSRPATATPPTPTPARPTPTPTQAAPTALGASVAAAVADFLQAVDAVQGGPDGLKGKEANELRDLARRVEEAAREGDTEDARERAAKLVEEVDKVSDDLRDDAAARLIDAARRVERAVEALPED